MSHGVGYTSIQEVTKRRRENCLQLHRLICDVELILAQKTLDEELNKQYWLAAQKWEGKVFKKFGESLNSHYENAVKEKLAVLSQKYMEEKRKRNMQGFDNSSNANTQPPHQAHPASRYGQHTSATSSDYAAYANQAQRMHGQQQQRDSTSYMSGGAAAAPTAGSSSLQRMPMSSGPGHHRTNTGYSGYGGDQGSSAQVQSHRAYMGANQAAEHHHRPGFYAENGTSNRSYTNEQKQVTNLSSPHPPSVQPGLSPQRPRVSPIDGRYGRSGAYEEGHPTGYGNNGIGRGYDGQQTRVDMRAAHSPPRSSSVPISSNVHPTRQSPHRNMDSHVNHYSSPMANSRNMDVSPVPGAYGFQGSSHRRNNQYDHYSYRSQGGNSQTQYSSPTSMQRHDTSVYASPNIHRMNQGQPSHFQQAESSRYPARYASSTQQPGPYNMGNHVQQEKRENPSHATPTQQSTGLGSEERYKLKYEEVLSKMRGSTIERINNAKNFYSTQSNSMRNSPQARTPQTRKSLHTINQLIQYLTDCENFLLNRADPGPGKYHHALFKLKKIYHNVITIEGKVRQQQQQRSMHSVSSGAPNQMFDSRSNRAKKTKYDQGRATDYQGTTYSGYAPNLPQQMPVSHSIKREEARKTSRSQVVSPMAPKSTNSQTVQSAPALAPGSTEQYAQPQGSTAMSKTLNKQSQTLSRMTEVKPEPQNNPQKKPNRKRNLEEAMSTTTQPERNVRPKNDAKSGKNFSALQRSKQNPEQQIVNLVDDEEPVVKKKTEQSAEPTSVEQSKPKAEPKLEKPTTEAKQSEDSDLELFTDEFFGSSPLLDYLAKNKDGTVNLDIEGFAEQADQVLSEFCSKF
eukprot:snap_masked-scaffold_18-processed-gene-1.26-mRNA-1 protein AED:1.00 eAED:1.00 QI:0/-1/0/0/-1/1/1/0/848